MKKVFNNVEINFRVQKNSNSDNFVLLLHGWGGNLNSFRGLEQYLVLHGYSVINMDFPGFGNSALPPKDFELDDYKKIVIQMLDFLKVEQVSVVAHSFGGRVAIMLAGETQRITKLVLVDSAGIKPKFNLLVHIKQSHYKLLKFLNKKNITKKDLSKFGSLDYKALPNQIKPVFVKIVNTDLTPLLDKISCPTLLIWGSDDKSTPLYMAKKMNKKIKNSALVVFKNAGHFSYLNNHEQFCLIVDSFLS